MTGDIEGESPESGTEAINSEILTDVEFEDEPGTVYAVRRITQGDRRVDWKVGHIEGTFAEGYDCYHEGELFERGPLQKIPENGPTGRYKDTTFRPLLHMDTSIEDGKMTIKKVYDADQADASEWATGFIEASMLAETIMGEWWGDAWDRHTSEDSD